MMTVKELIDELSKYPDDAEILFDAKHAVNFTYPEDIDYFSSTNEVVIKDY